MGAEAYFAILDDGPRRPVADYVQQLVSAGLPCREEPDEFGHWVVLEGRESTLNFTVEEDAAVFVTFDMSSDDPSEFLEAVERVFAEAGWWTQQES
jgi:predicted DNA-binding transcriptional regulator YafY